ncbi:protein RFT1-like protein [Corchorus olitorius]|uniref:Protein RFT1-like protein n=1 Tax=Corchorus olitorius TaxID=93759 RepID=A0A1R3FUL0_9ROSI|nr:protein RFT1-like protein [Corchorus olitorius]
MVYDKSVLKHLVSMLGGEHFLKIIFHEGEEFYIKA